MTPNGFPDGRQGDAAAAATSLTPREPIGLLGVFRRKRGQATTEVVLLFPLFLFFLWAFAKVYVLLILVQKMEIASYYAARRWQLESHRNADYAGDDEGALRTDILGKVNEFIGFGADNPAGRALDLDGGSAQLDISRTQVWQVVTLTVKTKPLDLPFYKSPASPFTSQYVPNRDRPIAFELPGVQ